MTDVTLTAAFETYRTRISILNKGYGQEKYRIEQIYRSQLGTKIVRSIRSVESVRLLNFDDLVTSSVPRTDAILAQGALLRHILTSMREAKPLPPPDQYLEPISEHRIIMIDPLAEAYASHNISDEVAGAAAMAPRTGPQNLVVAGARVVKMETGVWTSGTLIHRS